MNIRLIVIILFLALGRQAVEAQVPIDTLNTRLQKAQKLFYKDPAGAEKIALEVKELAETMDYPEGSGNAFRIIGLSYLLRGDYDVAVDNLLHSYSIFEQLNDSLMMVQVLSNLGVVYKNLKDYERSIEYYEKALNMAQPDDTLGLSKLYNNIGVVKQRLGKFDEAMDYFQQSLKLKQALGNQKGISNTLTNLGNVSIKKGQLDKGLKYFKASMNIEKNLGHSEGLAKTYNNIAALFLKKEKYDSAGFYASMALEIANRIETKLQIKEAASALAMSSEYYRDYKSAYEYKRLEAAMRDSINNEEVARKLGQLESKLELIKKEKAIESLTLNNAISNIEIEKKELHITWLVISLIITVFGASLVIYLLYSRYQLKSQLLAAEVNELRAQIKTLFDGDATELGLDLESLNTKLQEPLSGREFEILEFAISDLNNTEIADKIFVSVNTVKYHLKNIYHKLGVSNRKEALEYVIKTK